MKKIVEGGALSKIERGMALQKAANATAAERLAKINQGMAELEHKLSKIEATSSRGDAANVAKRVHRVRENVELDLEKALADLGPEERAEILTRAALRRPRPMDRNGAW